MGAQQTFILTTKTTEYVFEVTKYGHLEHIYYGMQTGLLPGGEHVRCVETDAFLALRHKRSAQLGSTVAYAADDPVYSLDVIPLEYSGNGKGDYRHSPSEIKMPNGTFVTDFCYVSHELIHGAVKPLGQPSAYADACACTTLVIRLQDSATAVQLSLYYTVFFEADVITRRAALFNPAAPLTVRKLMSFCIDMPGTDYLLTTFDGGWIKEGHAHTRSTKAPFGLTVNSSTVGASSNRHNPGFILSSAGAGEDSGLCYAFNLIYSGNHYSAVETSNHGLTRVMSGINPHCFEWDLPSGETFETPEAVMTVSASGYNGISQNMHGFVNNHIVRGAYKQKTRPVLINSWEAYFHDFSHNKLISMAKQAKKLGVELFVLDDGWFGERHDDRAGLGDYTVNKKKLPKGLDGLSKRIHRLGLQFGLWFEPEMVNEDSALYRAHPDWVVALPGSHRCYGRNQLVLDLCRAEVRDYIVEQVAAVLHSAAIEYVKWDFNRHISDMYSAALANQGEFFHRYVLGLYDILERIFAQFPHILLESCSSGGNRFDLGWLCYSPQIWASDNTDPIERIRIQGGLSYLYPQSAMGAHVSQSPHQQTLRATSLSTRFNVAAFGCFGYELDLKYLTRVEKREIKRQIAHYKAWRQVYQFGAFRRYGTQKSDRVNWSVYDKASKRGVLANYQITANASPPNDAVVIRGLCDDTEYTLSTLPQGISIKRFGGLVNHILPVKLHPDGLILRAAAKRYQIPDCVERYRINKRVAEYGIRLNNQFVGSHYNEQTRLLGDGGSNLYLIEERAVSRALFRP